MNYVNAMKLAAHIETLPVDMGNYEAYHLCGTATCIWGHAKTFFRLKNDDFAQFYHELGMTHDEGENLASPIGWRGARTKLSEEVQKERILAVLRGQIKLTKTWLHDPIYIDNDKDQKKEANTTSSGILEPAY